MSSTTDKGDEKKKNNEFFPTLHRHDDFDAWLMRVEIKFRHHGEWEEFCVLPCTPPDAAVHPRKYKKYMKKMGKAHWHIVSTLDNELLKLVSDYRTPYEVLKRLKDVFYGYTQLNCAQQFRHVMNLRYKKGQNLLEHLQEMKTGFAKLENMGVSVPQTIQPYVLIMSLDGAYDHVLQPYLVNNVAGRNAHENQLQMDTIVKLLDATYIEEEHKESGQLSMKNEEAKPKDTTESAMAVTQGHAQGQGAKGRGKCHHCGQTNHYISDCRIYKRKQDHGWRKPLPCRNRQDWYNDDRDPTRKRSSEQKEASATTSRFKSYKRHKGNDQQPKALLHVEDNASDSSEYAQMAIAGHCDSAGRTVDQWVLDSGASRHMTWQRDAMVNYNAISAVVHVGGGHDLHVDGVGDIQVKLQTDHGQQQLWLRSVYYVPDLQYNLFSVQKQLSSPQGDRVQVQFDTPGEAKLRVRGSVVRIPTDPQTKLFMLVLQEKKQEAVACTAAATVSDEAHLWHTRLGHPGPSAFKKLMASVGHGVAVRKLNPPSRDDCVPCIQGKLTRKSFRDKIEQNKKSWKIGERTHTDIWGPYAVPSYSGARYFCVFVDETSRFLTLFNLKTRDGVYEIFDLYRRNVECQKEVKMKSLRCDNAKEYLHLKAVCENKYGMECDLTVKKTSE